MLFSLPILSSYSRCFEYSVLLMTFLVSVIPMVLLRRLSVSLKDLALSEPRSVSLSPTVEAENKRRPMVLLRIYISLDLFLEAMNSFGFLISLDKSMIGLVTRFCSYRSKAKEKITKNMATPPSRVPKNQIRPRWISSVKASPMTKRKEAEWPTTTNILYKGS